VRQEIELFSREDAGRPIVPVLVEGEPASAIPRSIATHRYVDARGAWKFGWLRPAARDDLLRAVAAIAGEDLRSFIPWDRRRRRRRFAAVASVVFVVAIAGLLVPYEQRRAFGRPADIPSVAVIEFCDVVDGKLLLAARETHGRGTLEDPSFASYVAVHPDALARPKDRQWIDRTDYLPAGRLLHTSAGDGVRKRAAGIDVEPLRREAAKALATWELTRPVPDALEPGFWAGAPHPDVRVVLVAIKPSKLHPDAAEGPPPASSVVAIRDGNGPLHVQLLEGLYPPPAPPRPLPLRGVVLAHGLPMTVTADSVFIGMPLRADGGVGGLWRWDRRERAWHRENFSGERAFPHGNVFSIVSDPGRPGRVLLSTASGEWVSAAQKGRYAAQMYERAGAGEQWRPLSPAPVDTDSQAQLCGFLADGTLLARVDQAIFASGPSNLWQVLTLHRRRNS
jgi:hypothetical protein